MVDYIEGLIRKGLNSFPPKKPTTSLPVTFKKSNKLLREKLAEYLKKKLTSKFDHPPEISEEKNFKNLKSVLVKCAKYKNTLNKQNLKFHIHHGELLDEFHGFWIQERAEGNVTLNWNDWLIENKLEVKEM